MVSLYDTFAMFPSAHHHHHHHHHPAMGMPPSPSHPILSRHSHPGATQLNLHQHHQGMNPQAAYFGYTTHPHHYGQGAPQYGTNMMGNVEFHQQQFGGLVGGPDASTWYPGLAGVSPRTSGGAVGYEDWANSPNNVLSAHNPASSSGSTNAPGGVVSSPDSSPFQQHGSASPVDIPYPAAAYGKLLVASGNGEFAAPHHHLQLQSGQDIVSITPIPHNRVRSCSNLTGSAGGPGAGHHTPDSGLAGSDGLSSAGSPGQQQQQQPQQQQQQQQILAAANNNLMNMNNSNNLNEHGNGSGSVGIHHAGMNSLAAGLARPQPNRSPFEWMKKPSYQNSINPIRMTGANSNWITEEDGKTRTKDKYRVVYTDHQRLELEKEFHYSRYITIRRKSELAGLLGLSERQVKIWFQNRRAKERKQVKKREELLHKDKLDVVAPHPHGLHPHAVGPGQMSSVPLTAHPHLSQQQIDTKPVLGLD